MQKRPVQASRHGEVIGEGVPDLDDLGGLDDMDSISDGFSITELDEDDFGGIGDDLISDIDSDIDGDF